jgi:hypothetical protein
MLRSNGNFRRGYVPHSGQYNGSPSTKQPGDYHGLHGRGNDNHPVYDDQGDFVARQNHG